MPYCEECSEAKRPTELKIDVRDKVVCDNCAVELVETVPPKSNIRYGINFSPESGLRAEVCFGDMATIAVECKDPLRLLRRGV